MNQVTFAIFDNSKAQSKAESPPPKIIYFFSLNLFLSAIRIKIFFPSYFSASLTDNFLGSKDPTPPAIIIFGELKILFYLFLQSNYSPSL